MIDSTVEVVPPANPGCDQDQCPALQDRNSRSFWPWDKPTRNPKRFFQKRLTVLFCFRQSSTTAGISPSKESLIWPANWREALSSPAASNHSSSEREPLPSSEVGQGIMWSVLYPFSMFVISNWACKGSILKCIMVCDCAYGIYLITCVIIAWLRLLYTS